MENYLDKSDDMKVEIEAWELLSDKGSSVPRKKDEDAAAAAELFVDNGGRKPLECSIKDGCGNDVEQYVNNSECIQLDIDEVDECSLGPKYADVDVKKI